MDDHHIIAHLEVKEGNYRCSQTLNTVQNIFAIIQDTFICTSFFELCYSEVLSIIHQTHQLVHYKVFFFSSYVKKYTAFCALVFPWSRRKKSSLFPKKAIQTLEYVMNFNNLIYNHLSPFQVLIPHVIL